VVPNIFQNSQKSLKSLNYLTAKIHHTDNTFGSSVNNEAAIMDLEYKSNQLNIISQISSQNWHFFNKFWGFSYYKTEITPPPQLYSEEGASEMPKTAKYQLPAPEWPEKHFHLRISTFLAVLKWMWHLALEAGKH
jgi:hypothetical protein